MKSYKSIFSLLMVLPFALAAGTALAAHEDEKLPPEGRPVPGLGVTPDAPVLCNIMYQNTNYGGGQFTTQANYEWWSLGSFNDQMSSMVVYAGCNCTIYWDANFLGSSINYNRTSSGDDDIPNIGQQWNDQTSSIICYGP
jgi:hypothetical protein